MFPRSEPTTLSLVDNNTLVKLREELQSSRKKGTLSMFTIFVLKIIILEFV